MSAKKVASTAPTRVLSTLIRSIRATAPDEVLSELDGVCDVLIDNRAIGYRSTSVGGREASFEPLAETIVHYNLEMELSAALMDGELISNVLNRIFPKKESFKLQLNTGLLTMPMLIKEFRTAFPGDDAARTAMAQIMAELTANAIRHLNLVLPFDGVVSISSHATIFPSAATIMEAARVKRITDVLESMRLDPEIGRVKTLSAAALYSAMLPMFVRAGRLLIQTVEQDQYLADTLLILRLYITRDPALPKTLLGNHDLEALSTNLTYVLAAVSQPLRDLVLPEYYLRDAISDSALRLRELKRFSVKHLAEVKDWYVHYCLYDHPGQKVVGLIFARNMMLENRPQVTVFNQIESASTPVWTQTAFPLAENRVEPVLTQLYAKELNCQQLASLVSGVATYLHNDGDDSLVYMANAATEDELMHYAAALSRRTILTKVGGGQFDLCFMNEDCELNYNSKSNILGSKVLSSDPAEAVIHSGHRENVGESYVPTRIQGIPDTTRQQLLLSSPTEFTVNLGTPLSIVVNLDDEITLRCKTSISEMLVLPSQLRLSMTRALASEAVTKSLFTIMLEMANSVDITTSTGEIARLRAATALSNILLSMGASPSGRALTRSVFIKLMQSLDPSQDRDKVRGRLRHATISYRVAMVTGAKLLTAFDLITEEQSTRALSLISASGLEQYMIGSVPNMSDLV